MELPFTPSGTVVTSARVFLAAIFLIAGIPKIFAGKSLSNAVRALGVESRGGVAAARIGVPVAETAIGVWLLTGAYPAAASFSAAAMLAVFTYVLVQLRRREADGCACFVWDDGRVGAGHLVRNVVLVAVALFMGLGTLLGRHAWEPVWMLPTESLVVASAAVLLVLVLYALIVTSLQFARLSGTDSYRGVAER